MSAKIYITIENADCLNDILQEGRRKGLFKNLRMDIVEDSVKRKEFPVHVPVELNDVLDLVGNPIVKKMFGSKVDKAVGVCLQKILEAG